MNIKLLQKYVKQCETVGIKPTWIGLGKYLRVMEK